jgi:mono/diheme cytochrome c family protein
VRSLLLLAPVGLIAAVACTHTRTEYIDVPDKSPGVAGITDAGFDSQPPADSGLGILAFRPSTLYSGYDGAHTFQVPLAVYDSGDDLQVSLDDPSLGDLTPKKLVSPVKNGVEDSGKYYWVTIKGAGTITLHAAASGQTATAKITVTPYAPDRWATGQARYTTAEGTSPPCVQCHGGAGGIDHSPAAIATADDEKVATTIVSGIDPFGTAIYINGKPSHQWQVTDDEQSGLVTYLRALEPRGFQ